MSLIDKYINYPHASVPDWLDVSDTNMIENSKACFSYRETDFIY
jgi:hypothetical protein